MRTIRVPRALGACTLLAGLALFLTGYSTNKKLDAIEAGFVVQGTTLETLASELDISTAPGTQVEYTHTTPEEPPLTAQQFYETSKEKATGYALQALEEHLQGASLTQYEGVNVQVAVQIPYVETSVPQTYKLAIELDFGEYIVVFADLTLINKEGELASFYPSLTYQKKPTNRTEGVIPDNPVDLFPDFNSNLAQPIPFYGQQQQPARMYQALFDGGTGSQERNTEHPELKLSPSELIRAMGKVRNQHITNEGHTLSI